MEVSRLMKSRSSNSGKTKIGPKKKSRSTADLPPYTTKKRGVYVTSTHTVASKAGKVGVQGRPKSPPRPPKDNKEFLSSILALLSKSTVSTQYPDNEVPIKSKLASDDSEIINTRRYQKGRPKRKYKSMALNNEVDKEIYEKEFIVLQSKKDLTPQSINSSFSKIENPETQKYTSKSVIGSNKSMDAKPEVIIDMDENVRVLAKEISEGRKPNKRVRIDEPNTLISEFNSQEKSIKTVNSNTELYKFFVDLLNTTMSDDDFKNKDNPSKISSTDINLETNEPVIRKSKTREEPVKNDVDGVKTKLNATHVDVVKPDATPNFYCKDSDITKTYRANEPKKRKKSESYSFIKPTEPRRQKTESVTDAKILFSRKKKKENLINFFKEQLTINEGFEEPQNLYQALKAIAHNKKQCQTIHFEQTVNRNRKDISPGCMIRKRNVIPARA